MRILCLIFICLGAFAPHRDIDVGLPPGSPLEWDKDLHQPVPTGGNLRVPTVVKQAPPPEAGKGHGGGTQVSKTPEPFDYGVTNLYSYFGVTTHDIMTHIELLFPTGGLTQKGDVVTGGSSASGVIWIYPPYTTTETAWIGAAGCLRAILHPEVVSVPEIVAYLCEVGEPALIGSTSIMGPVGNRVKKMVTPLNGDKMPQIRAGATPFENMLMKLVTIELTSGYPHSLDPTYARRCLAFGDESFKAILASTKSDHTFLARNATAVLSNFKTPEAAPELRRIFTSTKDAVMKYRALTGMIRRKDRDAVPTLSAGLADKDEVHRAACAYALGMLGDPKALGALMGAARGTTDRDFMWSLLPACIRLTTGKEQLPFFLEMARKCATLPPLIRNDEAAPDRFNQKPMTPPRPEAVDTKLKVLDEMCYLGRVASLEDESVKTFLERLSGGPDGFYKANWFLLCDVAARLGKAAMNPLKSMFGFKIEASIQQAALIRLAELDPESSYLRDLVMQTKPGVGALALMILADHDSKLFREVAAQVIASYTGGNAGQAFLAGVAIQQLAKLPEGNGNNIDSLMRVATQANDKGWASRIDDQDPDITKAKIQIHPPLLEVVCVELGRLGNEKAVPLLIQILRGRADRGRAEAALGLGAFEVREAKDAMIDALSDQRDGWVRYCAYLSMKKWSGQDNFCDWIFGTDSDRKASIAKYRSWLETQPK